MTVKTRGRCSFCARETTLMRDGMVGKHKSYHVLMGRVECPGVGKLPMSELQTH